MTAKLVNSKHDYELMGKICNAEEYEFGTPFARNKSPEVLSAFMGDNYFIDNGANILAVAHLDIATPARPFRKARKAVLSPALDDRLGAYIILHMLPSFGIEADVLLTTNEESCGSTGKDFEPPKQYNWIFEFDRRGTDVVLYEYEDEDTIDLLRGYGWHVGMGSYTDVADMQHLEVKGFNFGTGYRAEHTPRCYAPIRDIDTTVARFLNFYRDFKDTHLPHTPVFYNYKELYGGWGGGRTLANPQVSGGVGYGKPSYYGDEVYDYTGLKQCTICQTFDDPEYDKILNIIGICQMCSEEHYVMTICEVCNMTTYYSELADPDDPDFKMCQWCIKE